MSPYLRKMISICNILLLFEMFKVLSQSPCDDSNAGCQFHYNDGRCRLYTGSGYEEISDQSFATIDSKCNSYWVTEYGSFDTATKCTQAARDANQFIWPVGECGCPLCECPSASFCCYGAPSSPFDINTWTQNAALIECAADYDMCHYAIEANVAGNTASVSCSNRKDLNDRLSLNVSSPLSSILSENNNTACYTFVESDNSTKLTCFCGQSGCNDIITANISVPALQVKNACYVSDSFHNEPFWSNYVYQDKQCEMCGISITNQDGSGNKVELSCKRRANCKTLLSEYGEYNDVLSGCAVTLGTTAIASTYTTTECCCDPSIDGDLCNEQFLTTQQIPIQSNFGCWKADFLTASEDNWDANAKRINCSYEYYKYCYIQSFGSNRYSSNCETESNCNSITDLENSKRVCCNDTDFCNQPSIFHTSSAANNSLCLVIIWIATFFSFSLFF